MLFLFNYQLVWNTLNRSCLKNFSNHFTEQKFFASVIKIENIQLKYYNLFQTITENISQLEFLHNKITKKTNRPIDHSIDDTRSFQSTMTE